MLVNLTDIFSTENKVECKEFEIDFSTVTVMGSQYELIEKSPVVLKLRNEGKGQAVVNMTAEFTLLLSCDRCLKEVRYPMIIETEERVTSPELVDTLSDEDDESFMEGYQLKVDDLLRSNIVLNWPMKILCREDCKGICKICGKDLNTGECGCDTFVPSPGLAGIKEIFNANKEV